MSMSKVKSYSFVMMALLPMIFGVEAQDSSFETKTPLLGITAVADEESEVVEPESAAGGAAEMSRYFSTHLHAELVNCSQSIADIFGGWLTDHELIPIEQETKPDQYFMRVWDTKKQGIFEATYNVNTDPTFVRVSLDFYDISGNHLTIQEINQKIAGYDLSKLWESLAEALECEPM